MNKIIIYGIGIGFKDKRRLFYENYDIVGFSDSNVEKYQKIQGYIIPEEIINYQFDYIVIGCQFYADVLNYLVESCGIPVEKIRTDYQILPSRDYFNATLAEDLRVALLFHAIGINLRDIRYLEFGTNDPVTHNNTYYLYRCGACGMLVEANPKWYRLIRLVRPRDKFIGRAISVKNDKEIVKLYETRGDEGSTLCIDRYDKEMETKAHEVVRIHKVLSITAQEVIKKLNYVPELFSIDIEGMDYDVLSTIDYKQFRPIIIIAETFAKGMKEQQGNEIKDLLERNGYLMSSLSSWSNGIFVREDKFTEAEKAVVWMKV